MKYLSTVACGALAALLAATAAQASAVTATSGSVSVQADARIKNGTTVSDVHGDSAAGLPGSMFQGAGANASSANGGGLSVFGYVYANWNSADSGVFQGQDFGWNWNLAPGDGGGSAYLNDGDANWTYAFTANSNAVFHLAYDVVGTGSTFGLQGWDLYVNGANVLDLFNSPTPNAKGTFDYNLLSGQDYLLELRTNANILTIGDLSGYQGVMNGDFQWNITASAGGGVPEPATWALMITGFGLAGAALRRRRVIAA